MAIRALAPYYNDDTVYTYTNGNSKTEVSKTVRQCVDEALDRLGSPLNEAGGFTSWNTDNVESIAQVPVALCAVGIDPAKGCALHHPRRQDSAGRAAALPAVGRRLLPCCERWLELHGKRSGYLCAGCLLEIRNGMSALYDMRADAGDAADACRAAMAAIEAADDSSAADYKAQLKQALALFRAVPEAERRYVRELLRVGVCHCAGRWGRRWIRMPPTSLPSP